LEWTFDPAEQWKFPDFAFGQERKWGRAVGDGRSAVDRHAATDADAFGDVRSVHGHLRQRGPVQRCGLFNGVEPVYMVPPYTGTEDDPI
jgi:hypothetical protein